ncbi:Peptidyl-prolyl cis-trans isomerase-like 4, partial [Galemys pyrenaicus]
RGGRAAASRSQHRRSPREGVVSRGDDVRRRALVTRGVDDAGLRLGEAGAMAVLLETTLGDVVIDLYTEERPRGEARAPSPPAGPPSPFPTFPLCPLAGVDWGQLWGNWYLRPACLNFLKLCKIKYYNYCLIHNVQRDFIIQTGDPTGTGRGGESVFGQLYGDQASFFEAEKVPRIKHKKKGTVSMVNNGSDQHGSQFLITTGDNLDYLDGVHTVFGEVTEGMDIIKKINETFVDKDFVPYQDIRINHTVILDDPFDDPPDLLIPDRSPEPTREQLDSGRIGADEEIDDFKGRSAEEVEEIKAEKEAKTQAILLEMVGDLPDADIKPPENVLFVCKLNPVTTDEDLEIIFSRFGPIRSCEVIRDWKTGESLCYAFIEFEKEEDCEKAFFKMDNVLIDDRRIHVDFSQSVAKVKWKGKGGKYTKSDFKEYEKEQNKPSNLVLKDKVKPKQEYPSQELVNIYSQKILSAKYDLILDEQAEDSKSSHSHTSKKHKKKTRHCSEEKEDEDYMPIKNTNQDIYREMGFGHYEEEESCWEKQKSEKRDRPQNRSRSRSRERDGHYSNSHKSKYQADHYERERSKKRDRSRSPKKSRDKEKSKYR